MKKILTLLFCLLSASLLRVPGAERLRERVYLSTDRDVYVAGDAVWLSAWCVDAGSGRLSGFSKTAYVEIHSADKLVQTAKIALDGGRGAGRLFLPTTLPPPCPPATTGSSPTPGSAPRRKASTR